MNKFIETKLGEVLAFARIGKDTAAKGRDSLVGLLSELEVLRITEEFNKLEDEVVAFATKEAVADKVNKSAKETEHKVADMRDMYVGGKWGEADEVLEWMGFYTGASLVHWQLIMGAAESLELVDLVSISRGAVAFYQSLISLDEKKLKSIGAARVDR